VSSKLPLILLPPSEGKNSGGAGSAWRPGAMSVDLDTHRRSVMDALVLEMERSARERQKLLGVKGDALEVATATNLRVCTAATVRAVDRYTGVLYGALDHSSLSSVQRRRLGSGVLIFSGLWGLVAPADPLPDYKLKMGASLEGLGKLSTWWRGPLTEALAPRARGRVVWNLLPNEHDAAWHSAEVPCRRLYTVRFLERRADGSTATVAHWNKFLKGALVRLLLEAPEAGPAELARWTHPSGYRLDPSATEEHDGTTRLTFVQVPTPGLRTSSPMTHSGPAGG
jgi:uncharacterized protein